jgi:hypothetical protein
MRLRWNEIPPRLYGVLVGLAALGAGAPISSQEPAVQAAQPSAELEELVGRIALYPDDLLSIILPGSTFPLQIVEADRWIQQNKGNTEAKPKDSWDESVKALINYPEVVTMMSNDLDWTSALGEAVAADQTAVMDAVQAFRRRADGAGNLQSDDKTTVVVEEDVVKIVQADPEVIYVPQYEPQVVVVQQTVPVYPTYYPAPYPVYYHPYPPGYSFAAGFFWGATVAYAFDWHGGSIHNDIDINVNRNANVNVDRGQAGSRPTDINRSQSQQMKAENRGSWQSQQSPSNVRQGRAPQASTGAGGAQAGTRPTTGAGGAQAGTRPTTGAGGAQAGTRPTTGAGGAQAGTRPTTGSGAQSATRPTTSGGASATNRTQASSASRYSTTSRNASTARSSPPSKDAFSGMSNGRSVNAHSSRGATSRAGGGGGGRRR